MNTKFKGLAKLSALEFQGQKLVIDHHGAKVIGLFFNDTNILFYDEEDIAHSGIPLCFPAFGALKNNKFLYEGKTYNMKQHGFIRDSVFTLNERGENFLTFELKSNAQTLEKFPFDFSFQVRYTLDDGKLHISLDFKNESLTKMPLAPGLHPYFAVDNPKDISFSSLATEGNDQLQDFAVVPVSDVFPLFENDQELLYHVQGTPILHLINHGLHETVIKPGSLAKIKMSADPQVFNRMVIWRNTENAPFICVEPANKLDDLNQKPIWVNAGESFNTELIISSAE
ncbi:MAG: hypothetical protein HRT88_17230 [Lentisphaeraceae bacterium]|nr:hypothetical protein [Lentisphaeraceae bacterium]